MSGITEKHSYDNGEVWHVDPSNRFAAGWRANCRRCRSGPWGGLRSREDGERVLREHHCEPPWDPEFLSGGKRTNMRHSAADGGYSLGDWWVGHGKDEGCTIEGPWHHWANLAARILAHPNTQRVAPELYQPGLDESVEDVYSEHRSLGKPEDDS